MFTVIFDLPPGSDLVFVVDEHGRRFFDAETGKVVVPYYFDEILKDKNLEKKEDKT